MFKVVNDILGTFLNKLADYAPNFFGGLLILFIGFFLSSILRKILLTLFLFIKLEILLEKTKLMDRDEVRLWEEIFSEILRWTVIILFLIPTLEVMQLNRATVILNQLLLYIPNVIVAVIIGFIGLITANLISDLVRHSIGTLNSSSSVTFSLIAKWLTIFFTILIILNQLGVAQDLVRILFTGIVVMVALAGGLAFGLGGQETARDILRGIQKRLKEK